MQQATVGGCARRLGVHPTTPTQHTTRPAATVVRNSTVPQVFDVTNRPSFESLSSWMVEAAKYGAPGKMVSRLTIIKQVIFGVWLA